ncbi:type VI secretion protein [Bartonella sp. HY329]|uniref:type VI secretion protein n=1 Tax=unclassified Bartonella TaxID=2645622 RepID=UPI0021C57640|nr:MULTISPECIES: type VI secretion protein [unclassified Bartonella]UXM95228.1 type VI secretion protein [Bartonella sp. HY329]UXN09552.1 type VI secretion protein [Bartonella sp. HY328]
MSKQYWSIAFKSFCLFFVGLGLEAQAQEQAPITDKNQKAMECRAIDDRMQRLLCFDELFKTPVEIKPVVIVPIEPVKTDGPIRSMAKNLETLRAVNDINWVLRMRPWQETMLLTQSDYENIIASPANRRGEGENAIEHQWTPQTVDVFMTMKEADVSADRPSDDQAIMMLSCENDISTLAVLLPKPIKTLQANIALSSGSGSVFHLNWRDVEDGKVIIAGRGLESIDTIKTLANYKRLQLQVNYPDGPRAFVFDMNDIGSRLKPLRTACHW